MATKKKTTAAASGGDVVELADKDGGFYDPETGFKVVRGRQAPLGPTVGKKTNLALLSGRLLIVGGRPSKANNAQEENEDV